MDELRVAGQWSADLARLSDAALADALERARRALDEASECALRCFRKPCDRWEKGPGQIVTDADLAVDRILHARLPRGGEGWLSEESTAVAAEPGAPTWVVDPIDGTRSFASGVAEFSISVALVAAGRPLLAVLANPATGERYEAVAGQGATGSGGRPPTGTLAATRSVALAGTSILVSEGDRQRRRFAERLAAARLVAKGSLAYKLALVAAGRHDAFVSGRAANDWDIAAGVLLVREAGGRVTDLNGEDIVLGRGDARHRGLIAAGAGLHASLLDAVGTA